MRHEQARTGGADEISIIDYWGVLARRRRLIAAAAGAALVVSLIVSLILPRTYASSASVMPPIDERAEASILQSRLAGSFGGAASLFDAPSSSKVWLEILGSRNVEEAVIRRFGLMNVYGQGTVERTRRVLKRMVSVKGDKAGVITITVEDRDPERAADLANAFVEELDRVNKGMVMSAGGRARVFIERRLREAGENLAKAEEGLKRFQQTNGAVKFDSQSDEIIQAIGRAKGQLMAKEVELGTLLTYAEPSNPKADVLRSEIEQMRGNIEGLEGGRGPARRVDGEIFIPTARFPDLTKQHTALMRDLKIQESLYELLVTQYEQAKIAEAKDSQTVQVLDKAAVPTEKAGPKRARIVVLSTLIATALAVIIAFLLEYVEALGGKSGKGGNP